MGVGGVIADCSRSRAARGDFDFRSLAHEGQIRAAPLKRFGRTGFFEEHIHSCFISGDKCDTNRLLGENSIRKKSPRP
jgi:hypothetical protein